MREAALVLADGSVFLGELIGDDPPGGVAGGRLHLDDFRAHVTEEHRRERPLLGPREVEDADAIEGWAAVRHRPSLHRVGSAKATPTLRS